MKTFNFLCFSGIALCLSACSLNRETYFGSKLPVTDSVQTFYSAKDVQKPYKVIGHMISPIGSSEGSQSTVKLRLIKKAKTVGANGLIFSDIVRQSHEKTTDDLTIKAEAIVFTNN